MIESERALFERTLEEFYGIQHELDDLQPRLADEATDEDVEEFFDAHHRATRDQLGRVEELFEAIDAETSRREPAALEGLVTDYEALTGDVDRPDFDDLAAIELGKGIERLEITKLEELLVVADRLDLPDEATAPLERSRTEAADALERLRELEASYAY